MRDFRDERMHASVKGRRLDELYQRHAGEVVDLLISKREVLQAAQSALATASAMAATPEARSRPIDAKQAAEFGRIVALLRSLGSRELKADIAKVLAALGKFEGTPLDALFKVPPRKGADIEAEAKTSARKKATAKRPSRPKRASAKRKT
jgi:hypothetical protein